MQKKIEERYSKFLDVEGLCNKISKQKFKYNIAEIICAICNRINDNDVAYKIENDVYNYLSNINDNMMSDKLWLDIGFIVAKYINGYNQCDWYKDVEEIWLKAIKD